MKILLCRWVIAALLASSVLEADPIDARTVAVTQVSTAVTPSHVVAKGSKARVAFKVDGAAAARVLDTAGRDITSKILVTAVGAKANDLTLELQKNQVVTLLTTTPQVPASPSGRGRRYLPGTVLVAVADPKQPDQLALFKGSVFLEMQTKPLQWQADAKAYTTGLTIGLEADPDSQVRTATFSKTTVTLRSTGGGRVSKAAVDFTEPGVVSDLMLSVEQPDGVVTVTARYGAQSVDDQAEVAVRVEQLGLRAAKNRILGYGLEQTTLMVVRLNALGQPMADTTVANVQFSVTGRGKIELVQAPEKGPALATLTSEGTGASTVTASIGTLTDSADIQFIFPLSLILAALIGAMVGGLCRGFRAGVRKRVRWGRLVLEACVTGLLFTAIVFVGLIAEILPPALAKSEIGVFVVAGLAGFVGASVLDLVTKKIFGEGQKSE